MLYIYFCDDNKVQLARYTEFARKGILLKTYDIAMGYSAVSPEDLLAHLPAANDTGLYFLDIEFPADQDGFQLAKRIRQKDPRAFLVFLTSHGELAMDTFSHRLEAMHFIVKSPDEEQIQKTLWACIETAYERYLAINHQKEDILSVKCGNQLRFLPCSGIRYLTSSEIPHHITLFTDEEILDCPGSIAEFQKKLSPSFLRINRSTLINSSFLKNISLQTREVLLDGGITLACSMRCFLDLKKSLKTR